jgi:hypothetical protein
MTTYAWKGDSGPTMAPSGGNYSTAADWSPGGVPGEADKAIFGSGQYTVTSSQSTSVGYLGLADQITLQIVGGTFGVLGLSGPSGISLGSNSGTITVGAGSSFKTANTTNSTSLLINHGSMDFYGTSSAGDPPDYAAWVLGGIIELNGGGSINLSTGVIEALSASVLQNDDNIISGSGAIGDANLTLINGVSGTINANASSPLTINAAYGGSTNSGLIEASAGGTLILQSAIANEVGGMIAANGGTVTLNNSVSNSGTISASDGGTIDIAFGSVITGGTITVQDENFFDPEAQMYVEGYIYNAAVSVEDDNLAIMYFTTQPGHAIRSS